MSSQAGSPIKVLFVCLGNICRSPTAHGVFQGLVEQAGLTEQIIVDSAGTASWHEGRSPDERSQQAASKRGYDLSTLRARQAVVKDFAEFDYILAMDSNNLSDLRQIKPGSYQGELSLFLDFADQPATRQVPDPYYGGDDGFELVLDLIESASQGLLQHIQTTHLAADSSHRATT